MKKIVPVIVLFFLAIPQFTFAQGFVPCSGTNCTECHLVQMGNTILIWLIGILFMLFAFMVFVAGWGLITSGGNPSAKEAAKSKLLNAVIGLLIVLAAWLIVDTLMRALLTGGSGQITGYGPWSQVQCGAQTQTNFVGIQSYTSITTVPQACGGSGPSCASLVSNCTAIGGTPTVTPSTVSCTTATGIASSTASVGACDTSVMSTISFLGRSVTVDNRLVPRLQSVDAAWQSAGGNSYYDIRSLGSYNCRQVTGGSNYSYHAYGFALDINSGANGYGPKTSPCPNDMSSQSPPFYTLFTSQGFGWGGNWNSVCDAMHFSAASGEGGWLPRP